MTKPEPNRATNEEFQRQLVDVLWGIPFYVGLATASGWMGDGNLFFLSPGFLGFLAVAGLCGFGQRATIRRLQLPPATRDRLRIRHHAILFGLLALILFSGFLVMAVINAVIDQKSLHFPVGIFAARSLILAAAFRIIFHHFRPVSAAVSHSSERPQATAPHPVR